MGQTELISAKEFCVHHSISYSIITELCEAGVLQVTTIEEEVYIPDEQISEAEKLVRMHTELDINIAGLEAIAHLLKQVKDLQQEVRQLSGRLTLYED